MIGPLSARRVLTRADERFAGLLQWISGTIDEIKASDVLEYRRTTDLSTVDTPLYPDQQPSSQPSCSNLFSDFFSSCASLSTPLL